MADDWIEKRFERKQQHDAEIARRARLESRVPTYFGELFASFRKQVKSDVEKYNELFPDSCSCLFESSGTAGFTVTRRMSFPSVTLRVVPIGDLRTCRVDYIRHEPAQLNKVSAPKILTVAPDYDRGEIYFKWEGEFVNDLSELSEKLLDSVIC